MESSSRKRSLGARSPWSGGPQPRTTRSSTTAAANSAATEFDSPMRPNSGSAPNVLRRASSRGGRSALHLAAVEHVHGTRRADAPVVDRVRDQRQAAGKRWVGRGRTAPSRRPCRTSVRPHSACRQARGSRAWPSLFRGRGSTEMTKFYLSGQDRHPAERAFPCRPSRDHLVRRQIRDRTSKPGAPA
jgi:hypothetical protein